MKPLLFLGDSRRRLKEFPDTARSLAGFELRRVQSGLDPTDWKPMPTVGSSVREIRVRDENGAFRVVYLATLPEAVLVLHAFGKKTRATAQHDLALATARLKSWKG